MLGFVKELFGVYKTPKLVKIHSAFLATTYLVLVILVWGCYLGSYQLDIRKVYQKTCKVSGSVLTKTKGALSTEDLTEEELHVPQPELYQRVWDNSDLVFLSHGGSGGFFLTTNLLITPNQTKAKCPEVFKTSHIQCTKNVQCKKGAFSRSGHGILTGVCVNDTKTCEVSAWCPIETDILPLNGTQALLSDTEDFTVMIKNAVEFSECGSDIRGRNILKNSTRGYLANCMYDPETDPNCPIFRIGDIVKWSNENFSKVAITGGVFQVDISWNCDFDWGKTMDDCFPKYTFSRIDGHGDRISPGWNFRAAKYDGQNSRTLTKYYGLKFHITLSGEGKCFDFLTLVLTIGATIGFFSVAPLVCETLLELFSKLKKCSPFHLCFATYSANDRIDGHKNAIELQPHNESNATIYETVGDSRHHLSSVPL